MKPRTTARLFATGLAAMLAVALMAPTACGRGDTGDAALAREIDRWAEFVRGHAEGDGLWKQIEAAASPMLDRADSARRGGLPLLGRARFAAAHALLAAADYTEQQQRAGHADSAGFEREWSRMGGVLAADLEAPQPADFASTTPAALRAIAEAARLQVRTYYEASLEYGRSTEPVYGLFYIGQAVAQHQFVALARTLDRGARLRRPAVRSIAVELDSLESQVLAAYRPPASIDRHPDFIRISATIKEARELDAARLYAGALYRYLSAARDFDTLQAAPPALDAVSLRERVDAWQVHLGTGLDDHSIGLVFLEGARELLRDADSLAAPPAASAIVSDVLPRYLAALGPAPPAAPAFTPEATVTLVRWPYT